MTCVECLGAAQVQVVELGVPKATYCWRCFNRLQQFSGVLRNLFDEYLGRAEDQQTWRPNAAMFGG